MSMCQGFVFIKEIGGGVLSFFLIVLTVDGGIRVVKPSGEVSRVKDVFREFFLSLFAIGVGNCFRFGYRQPQIVFYLDCI